MFFVRCQCFFNFIKANLWLLNMYNVTQFLPVNCFCYGFFALVSTHSTAKFWFVTKCLELKFNLFVHSLLALVPSWNGTNIRSIEYNIFGSTHHYSSIFSQLHFCNSNRFISQLNHLKISFFPSQLNRF